MRVNVRIVSTVIIACMLLLSIWGCGSAPAGDTDTPSFSPAATDPPGDSPTPYMDTWGPVAEEDLSESDLDAWMDMKLLIMASGSLGDLRDYVEAVSPAVSPTVADAMVCEYIKALREYKDTYLHHILTPEVREALFSAYQDDGSFDTSGLDSIAQDLLASIEGTEIGWITLEGLIEPRIRYDDLADISAGCSPVFTEYLRLMAMDESSMPAVDGALRIGYSELADRTLACEDFLIKAAGTPFQGDVERLYVRYLYLLLSGADYPSVLDMQLYADSGTFAMNTDAQEAFQHVLDTQPESDTAAAVTAWWEQIRALAAADVAGETAYRQLWDGFSDRIVGYASGAGVRIPRVYLAVWEEMTDTGLTRDMMEYPALYGDGVDQDALDMAATWISAEITEIVQGTASPYTMLRLSREAGPIISVVTDISSDAENLYVRDGYNFDPATGEHVNLEDLFDQGVDPWILLEKDVGRQIALIQERVEETGSSLFTSFKNYTGVSEGQQWYATDEGIVVVFQPGGLDPFSVTEFTVPWWRLEDYLK